MPRPEDKMETASSPIDVAPSDGRRRSSIFDWFSTLSSSPSSSMSGSPSSVAAAMQASGHHRANSYSGPERPSIALIEEELTRSSALKSTGVFQARQAKPRTMSQSGISHDEALNLSRAGLARASSLSARGSGSPTATPVQPVKAEEPRKPIRQRPRQGSKSGGSTYEGIGLVAAYSGGPSSF